MCARAQFFFHVVLFRFRSALLPITHRYIRICLPFSCLCRAGTRYIRGTKRCRLSWLTYSALVYEPKWGGGDGEKGSYGVEIYTGA
jgi:hypothetical protein